MKDSNRKSPSGLGIAEIDGADNPAVRNERQTDSDIFSKRIHSIGIDVDGCVRREISLFKNFHVFHVFPRT